MSQVTKISPNKGRKTFTIWTTSGKYRTAKMSRYEFQDAMYNTYSDWEAFLKTDQSYYPVR